MFKLYDQLKQELYSNIPVGSNGPVIQVEWQSVTGSLSMLNEEHSELVMALIIHHYCITNDFEKCKKILEAQKGKTAQFEPYRCKTFSTGKGVMVSLDNIPLELQGIIALYVKNASK